MDTQDIMIDWNLEIEKFIEYFSRFDSRFESCIKGADIAEINQVEKFAGLTFPPEYRAFLLAFGNTSTNSLRPLLEDTEFNIASIKKFYADPDMLCPPNAIFLWTVDVDYTLFLSTNPARPSGQPVIHVNWTYDDEIDSTVKMHDSLIELLYGKAFGLIRQEKLAYYGEFTVKRGKWDDKTHGEQAFRRLFDHLGFSAVPFMEKHWICRDRDDAGVSFYKTKGVGTPIVQLSCSDEKEFGRLSELIEDNLAMWRRAYKQSE